MKISAVIIANNEERNIERCIQSAQKICEEVIVGDTGSTDATAQLAREAGAKVFSMEWEGFAKTKNKLNLKAKNDYILSLDADEALSDELFSSLKNIEKLEGAYSFNRKTNYCGKWIKYSGWYPDTKIRLFPKNTARWSGGDVHEILDVDKELRIAQLKGDLLHYSYYESSELSERLSYYAELANPGYASKKNKKRLKAGLSALWSFVRIYFLKLGFLDGSAGFQIAAASLTYTYRKHL